MNTMLRLVLGLCAAAASVSVRAAGPAETAGPEAASALVVPMPFEAARERSFAWAAAQAGANEPPEAVRTLWAEASPGLSGRPLHDLVVRSFAAADSKTAAFVAALDPQAPPLAPPDVAELTDTAADGFYRTNLDLFAARFLAESRLFDEAHTLLEETDLTQAVDPVTALFHQAVCEHQLLMPKEGLATLGRLSAATGVPESYAAVARLMEHELKALEPDSLDEISGLMRDVERRLELARAGQRVQKREDEIVSKLDEMIKKIEQQMSQSSSSGNGGSGGNQSSAPAGQSVVKGSTAPGEADRKTVRRDGGWGDLPPRERDAAKNEIEKAFPANYGRLINEYFLKRSRADRPAE